ncbi:MAG: COX15/CtaA family protein [Actinobacteria bacterium]|nr:COX15/CtaA family protein [Actinomycetota bacterium]
MVRPLSPSRYAWITRAALTSLVIIVITGAAVRLTGSGLGCSDWPRCSEERLIDVSSFHGAVEQLNRLFTGIVAVLVVSAVLAARFLRDRRRDLERLAGLLVVGVIGQVLLGGIVVLTDLNPVANQGHFLLSMFLVGAGLILVKRAGGDVVRLALPTSETRLVRLVAVLASFAIVTGTVVTGAGPHAGDEKAPRLDVAITAAARLHGISVIATLLAIVLLLIRIRRRSFGPLHTAIEVVLVLGVLQATVGYVQYFNDIPAALVAIHIALATAFFMAVINLWYSVGPLPRQADVARRVIVSR